MEQKWTRFKNPAAPTSPACPSKCLRMAQKQEESYIWMMLRGKRGKQEHRRHSWRSLEQPKRGEVDKIRLTIQAAACLLFLYWLLLAIKSHQIEV